MSFARKAQCNPATQTHTAIIIVVVASMTTVLYVCVMLGVFPIPLRGLAPQARVDLLYANRPAWQVVQWGSRRLR